MKPFPWLRRVAKRLLRGPVTPVRPATPASAAANFWARKAVKLARLRPLVAPGVSFTDGERSLDFLTPDLRDRFRIDDTANVSSHEYDGDAQSLIRETTDGFILDCGAGLRGTYYDHVVNYEICDYDTTDVRGVAERLPFRDGVFDAAFSFNVLEHVVDPFACANELARVLKPGGRLYCVVPFLQPYHAYPHHYYNMTAQGVANLFRDTLTVDRQDVNTGGMPIFMLTWVLRRYAEGLPEPARSQFLRSRVRDLTGDPRALVDRPFVRDLPPASRFELAATTSLFATKRAS